MNNDKVLSLLGLAKKADGSNYIAGTSAEIKLNGETFKSNTKIHTIFTCI